MVDKLVQVIQSAVKRTDVLTAIIITALLTFGILYYLWIPTLNYMLKNKEATNLLVKENNAVLKNKFSIYEERIKLYKERIEFLKERLDECPDKNKSIGVLDIKFKLQGIVRTPYYEVMPFLENELVSGKNGKYYIIDIKKAHKKNRIRFDAGQYTISAFESEYTNSISNFITDIISNIAGKVEYDIFIKGSADIAGNTTFSNHLNPNYEYKAVHYYPQDYTNSDKFIPIIESQKIPNIYKNKHLPNLRAKFISEKLKDAYDMDSIILDGNVSLKVDKRDRNVLLLLFVRW